MVIRAPGLNSGHAIVLCQKGKPLLVKIGAPFGWLWNTTDWVSKGEPIDGRCAWDSDAGKWIPKGERHASVSMSADGNTW